MLAQETVSWVSVTTSSDGFDSTFTESAPVDTLALVAARTATENADTNAPAVIVGLTLYLLDTSIEPSASDWFTVRGGRYEVDGEPHRWGSKGVEVAVRRAKAAQ